MKTNYLKKIVFFILSIIKFIVDQALALTAFAIILLLAIPVGFYGMYLYIEPELPSMTQIQEPTYKMPMQVYTKDKYLIGEFGKDMSLPIGYEKIPKKMIQAFLAAEDDTFFSHDGISIKGLGRAITEIVSNSGQQTGGSTITMQVAKNYFLSSERTFKRKLTELFLARRIEQNLSKEEILTLYVNKIYLGENAYGIAAAAKRYYSKTLDHLTTAQMAMIAGLPKAPSQNNPTTNPEKAMARRNWILGRMLSLNYISQEEHDKALKETLNLKLYQTKRDKSYPYLAEWARYELVKKYGKSIMQSGWRVKLTIGTKRQDMAANALQHGLRAYTKRHGWHGPDPKLHGQPLRYFSTFQGNWPAKIIKVRSKTMDAALNDGRIVKVYWSGTRKYVSPNRVGYFSSNASKVFKEDDIIHIRPTNDAQTAWRVSLLPKVQGALVAVNPDNGAIDAMAGGYHFHYSKFNRATQGWRQPGSIIKPLIYTLALEKGYRPNSMVSDEKLRVGSWKPKNSDGRYYGKMPLRRALYLSRNLVSIRLLQSVGIGEARQFLSQFGLRKAKLPSNLTLALGTGQVLPVQMATAYATFANGGHRVQPYFIDSIYNTKGDLIYLANPARACAKCYNDKLDKSLLGLVDEEDIEDTKKSKNKSGKSTKNKKKSKTKKLKSKKTKKQTANKPAKSKALKNDPYSANAGPETDKLYKFTDIKLAASQAPRIITPRVAYDMASILKDVVVRGTGRRAQRTGRSDIGGKTGTTNLAKDAWFAGFQPTLSAVVWVGYDIPRPLGRREYGGVAALPIWSRFMRQALSGVPTQWVTGKNLSDSKKQGSKIIRVEDGEEVSEEDKQQTGFQMPPKAYYIQRKPKPKPKPKPKNILTQEDLQKRTLNQEAAKKRREAKRREQARMEKQRKRENINVQDNAIQDNDVYIKSNNIYVDNTPQIIVEPLPDEKPLEPTSIESMPPIEKRTLSKPKEKPKSQPVKEKTTKVKPKAESKPKPEPKPKTEPKPKAESRPKPKKETKPKPEPQKFEFEEYKPEKETSNQGISTAEAEALLQ